MDAQRRTQQQIPRVGSLERDMWVRGLARSLCDAVLEIDEVEQKRLEQFLGGLVHYLLGRVHDRIEFPREAAVWRGKHALLPLIGGLIDQQRAKSKTEGEEPVRDWMKELFVESTNNKYNPLAAKTFRALTRLDGRELDNLMHNASAVVLIALGQGVTVQR